MRVGVDVDGFNLYYGARALCGRGTPDWRWLDTVPDATFIMRVPVGTVNPSPAYLAGALRGTSTEGVGRHWWRQLAAADLKHFQPQNPAGGYLRPLGW
jgi:hypothetical protein